MSRNISNTLAPSCDGAGAKPYESATVATIPSKAEVTIESTSSEEDDRRQPADFIPGPNHVICARGKGYWHHQGNKKYRQLIAENAESYGKAANKLEKTLIVSRIVESVENSNPKGSFVKKDKTGRWVQVDDYFAREKIGQSLRDSLDSQYRSSTKNKKRRRSDATEKLNESINEVIHSSKGVSRRIKRLWRDAEERGQLASDASVSKLFLEANRDILTAIKKDTSLVTRFQEAVDLEAGSPTKALVMSVSEKKTGCNTDK